MNKKANWQEFEQVLKDNRITKLYHFTDFDNLESIIAHGGLYSWADYEEKGIKIAKPGGSSQSRSLDQRDRLEHYVRLSFAYDHPMKFVAMNDGRISNPAILEIDIEAALWEDGIWEPFYKVSHQDEFREELQEAVDAQTKDSNFIKTAMGLKKSDFEKDVLGKLLSCSKNIANFRRHIEGLRKRGLIAHDDYSIAII